MNCEYCKNEFKTTSSLNNHKNKSKYCLIIQGKIEPKDKILSTKQEKIEEFKCEYCNKILSSKQYLESHMKKCEIIEEEKIFQCEFCKKILSTKQKLEYHTNICDKENISKELKTIKEQLKLKDKELKELKLKDKKLKEELELKDKELKKQLEKQEKLHNEQLIKQKELKIEFKKQLEKIHKEQLEKQEKIYKEQIEKQEEQNKILLNKLEILATKAIQRPTIVSNTTNNNLNIATSMDFDNIEHITNLIDNYLTINHVIDGQKGIANFVKETMLIDENGISKYVCTDPSRNIFKYKDTNGEIQKDVEAKKLTGSLIKGGIRKQTAIIGNKWVVNEDTDNNYLNKLEIMMDFQENIHKLGDNNTNFRKELASITS